MVVDECHLTLSKVYRQLYTSVNCDHLLCLTGTEHHNPEYAEVLNTYAPTCFVRTTEQAVEDKAVSATSIFNLAVPLDKTTKAKVDMYTKLHNEAKYALMDLSREYHLGNSLFDVAKTHKDNDNSPAQKASKQFWFTMGARRLALQKAASKVEMAKRIISLRPDKK
jgi:superfamily II DNA or RNA helicase